MRAKIDQFLNRWASRKLIVFFVACFGLFSGTLTSSDWVTIATAYVATQGFIDIVSHIRNNAN